MKRKKELILTVGILLVCVVVAGLSFLYVSRSDGEDDEEDEEDEVEAHVHSYTESVVEPTCIEQGYTLYTCSCEESYRDNFTNALGHDYENGTCARCGAVLYTYNEDETCVYFGSYPQTLVASSNSLAATLNMTYAQSSQLPSSSDAKEWTDYGYYISGSVASYMWYLDVTYENEEYRGVYFTSYRPYWTDYPSSTSYSNQDDNGYYISTVYWFKYESIEWRILSSDWETAFLMTNIILDGQEYYASTSSRTVNGRTVYANNYKYSTVRNWLNETFYNTAFNEYEQAMILLTMVDNGASTTYSSDNSYVCANTSDYVFLLSYQDALNIDYGFSDDKDEYDTARQLKPTDYAQSQGVYTQDNTTLSYYGCGWWWLRSPDYRYSYRSSNVGNHGMDLIGYHANNEIGGIVPALFIRL